MFFDSKPSVADLIKQANHIIRYNLSTNEKLTKNEALELFDIGNMIAGQATDTEKEKYFLVLYHAQVGALNPFARQVYERLVQEFRIICEPLLNDVNRFMLLESEHDLENTLNSSYCI